MSDVVSFPFGEQRIEREGDLFFVFEMANNHQGDVAHGLALIDALAKVTSERGVKAAVKFQFRTLEEMLHPGFLAYGGDAPSNKHVKRFLETRLSNEDFAQMIAAVRSSGMTAVSTPFDERSVQLCVEFDLPVIKIASCSATDWPLLQAVAATSRPVVCSTGGCSLVDIDNIVEFFTSRSIPLAIMHCVSIYPTPRAEVRMDEVRILRDRFPGLVIGYSGHESIDDLSVVELAVASGASILERHVGLPTESTPLNSYSLAPEDVARWIDSAIAARDSMGMALGGMRSDEELLALAELKRGVYARRSRAAGEFIDEADLMLAMPLLPGQFDAAELHDVVGLPAPHDGIHPMMPVMKNGSSGLPKEIAIASVIERVKELLARANVALPDETPAELSHPYGLESFERNGAVIIDVVNREYCKKLIVQLPRQDHPMHKHVQKEETFHLLFGELETDLNGERRVLKAGDSITVERGVMHGFKTRTGMVMEEISTTHIKGDSFYLDEQIPSDPTTRKTAVTL